MNASLKISLFSLAISLSASTMLFATEANAQTSSPDRYPSKTAYQLLQQYGTGDMSSLDNQNILMGVLIKRLQPNEANIALVRQDLAKSGSADDKILLIKLLASMYTPRVRTQINLQIENDLRKLIDVSDKRIAAGALIEYSRLAYPTDRYQVLQRAHTSKVIDEDTYYGELAHGLRFSTPAQQIQMLDEMASGQNAYGHEVLAATYSNQDFIRQLAQSSKVKLLHTLSSCEPNFPMALDSFGGFDIARYAIWTDTTAMLGADVSGRPYPELVLERLSDPKIDPRKILAVLGSPEGQRVIRESKEVAKLRTMFSRGQAYVDMLPQNVMLSGALQNFSKEMSRSSAMSSPRN